MANRSEKNILFRVIGKIVSSLILAALLFVIGIVIAACVKQTGFTTEWANMVLWVQSWAK